MDLPTTRLLALSLSLASTKPKPPSYLREPIGPVQIHTPTSSYSCPVSSSRLKRYLLITKKAACGGFFWFAKGN